MSVVLNFYDYYIQSSLAVEKAEATHEEKLVHI